MKPRLLDLYCKAGGAGMGYARAGFEIAGVDIEPQPHYPFEFHQTDALEFLRADGGRFQAVHASPPCQKFSHAQRLRGYEHRDLIAETREALLERPGRPYIIENVPGAPLRSPVMLCGAAFGLRTYRHRLFESQMILLAPPCPGHRVPVAKMGRPPKLGEFMHVCGNFSDVAAARRALGVEWMTRDELAQAVPPVYTWHLGRQILAAL